MTPTSVICVIAMVSLQFPGVAPEANDGAPRSLLGNITPNEFARKFAQERQTNIDSGTHLKTGGNLGSGQM
jgi:hypothetical protein